MKNIFFKPIFWLSFLIISGASALLTVHYFPLAHSIITVPITMNRNEAIIQATNIARQYSLAPANGNSAVNFQTDYLVQFFVELDAGGKEAFTQHLDSFFTIQAAKDNKHLGQEGMIGQYAHGNEPSHHIAYLYAYSTNPIRGIELLKQICNQFYNNTPAGITGNDDCGQMSAWYILTTLGFYPVNPANGAFVFGYPQAQKIKIKLPNEKIFSIEIMKSDQTINNIEISLNGSPINSKSINYTQIMNGGNLKFKLN